KSYSGARMICRLVDQGKKVGITANSHKVIRNLLDKVLEASEEMGVELRCIQKPKEMEPDQDRLVFARNNGDVYTALAGGQCQVAGATHFLWSRADAHDVLDVLVVDEAAQMSLANVVAVAQSARTLILLGDPQQLDQPTQGTHPDGTGVSSLEHVLQEDHTIAAERGLFLDKTWRLHPAICAFNSELFYDSKLTAQEGCEAQIISSGGPLDGNGLRYLPVPHTGNQSSSIEEAEAVANLVNGVLAHSPRWTDREGAERTLSLDDIVIITPYNAQVFEIQQRLPGARVGTVDKFQGQEAPIAIYSMATSSYADAPRGMEFLYSANRFNVAISRAKCVAVLVASPDVFEAECKTPRQMQLANAFCRYLECAAPAIPP
ncbi:MAG: AAA domain-containing protein, partial [Candidatus Thiodiazotropha sp.]